MRFNVRGPARRVVRRLSAQLGRRTTLTRVGTWLLIVVVLAIGITVWDLRRATVAAVRTSTDNLAIVLAAQTGRSVQAVDIVLRDIQERIATFGVTTPDEFRRVLGTQAVHDFLRSRADRLPQVDNIALVGADGIRVNYSLGWPAPAIDMSDRDYARHFTAQDDPGLFISEPVVNRATFVRSLYLVRRVNGADGAFLGLVLGSVPLKVFHELYNTINLPASESLMLLRRDGTVLARHPDPIDRAGAKMPADSPWYAQVAQGGGFYESPGVFESAPRLVAVRPLRDYPLVMDVALSKSAALATWRREATLIGLGTACAASCLLLLLRALERQFNRLQAQQAALRGRNAELTRSASALAASEARLAGISRELETTLASMDQGLVMVDAAGTVAVCNRRAIEILDLPAELMAVRPQFDSVAQLRLLTDARGAPSVPVADGAGSEDDCPLPLGHERELSNGRIVEVCSLPLASGGGWVATYEDITARRHAERQVVFMARHDALTRLPNRRVFRERIEAAVAQAERAIAAAVLCLDLDHFKEVNDTLGHPVGDVLLRVVAERLSACIRQVDTVARFGGDEFAVVQVGPERAEDVAILAQRMIDVISMPYEVSGHQVIVGVSLGIAMVPADGSDPDTLLKHADIALYRAKADGRGIYRFFAAEMDARLQERRKLELELHHAVANDEFELFYQPVVDLGTDRICGFEALLRWHHPTRGLLEAAKFIWLIEEMGLVVPLGRWALRQACREAMNWPDDVRVAVNLSPVQFNNHNLIRSVTEALEAAGLPARRLELEITESVLLRHNAENVGTLHALRALGVHIAMDDFGTGYSSLSYLRSFPFDTIKIDQSFVRDLPTDADAAAIVRAIAAMGVSLGMSVTAEGVERVEQLAQLRDKGCTAVQGYLFSVARPARDIQGLLERLHPSEQQVA